MKTEIAFILDRSGSMESMTRAAIAGYNEFLAAQQATVDDHGQPIPARGWCERQLVAHHEFEWTADFTVAVFRREGHEMVARSFG
jgi:hypothetical protein